MFDQEVCYKINSLSDSLFSRASTEDRYRSITLAWLRLAHVSTHNSDRNLSQSLLKKISSLEEKRNETCI